MTLVRSVVLASAVAVVLAGLWVTPQSPELWRLALAAVAVAVAQMMPVRHRVGAAVFVTFWGEAALILGLYLLPPGWVPLGFVLGAFAIWRLRWCGVSTVGLGQISLRAGGLVVAAGAGALISGVVAAPYQSALTLRVAVGLGLAAFAYFLISTVIVSVLVGSDARMGRLSLIWQLLGRRLSMFIGNVAVGITVIALVAADWRLLLGLPLLFWLLHRTYSHRLRVVEDRRLWTALAKATRSLNQPDEHAVVVAGVRGALDVFAVGRAEVEIEEPSGRRRAWVGDRSGQVSEFQPVTAAPQAASAQLITVPLLVGGDELGQLRVFFPANAGPADGDWAALRAYGDALAAALKDTVTHQALHQLLARSARDAQRDPLTGLLNRGALFTRGETAAQLLPHAQPVALLLADVNHFRDVNDTLGHMAGDEVLRLAAKRLSAAAQHGDLLARLGADEFALLVTDMPTDLGAALACAVERGQQLVDRFAGQADVRGTPVPIEASVGVVVAPAGTADVVELLRRANSAMWRARYDGKAVGWYDSTSDGGGTDRLALLAELRSALSRDDELVLMWHPVVNLATGVPIEMEALVRWHHPRRGLLMPADFIRAVEHSELLGTFTEYVIDQALTAATRWARRSAPIPVAVNLSARSLLDPRLPGVVDALLRKHQVPGRRLVLEITETAVSSELPAIAETLASLRALGVRLAVDDFGTGYASLTFLTRVRLDEVKIDRSFVATMAESAESAAIVRITVELGRELGVRVVAEGVEDESQRRLLERIGCPAAQGFHFGEPTPADQVDEASLRPRPVVPGQVVPDEAVAVPKD